MILTVNLTEAEVAALSELARGRQVRVTAGTLAATPEDRAIAKVLLAAMESPAEAGKGES